MLKEKWLKSKRCNSIVYTFHYCKGKSFCNWYRINEKNGNSNLYLQELGENINYTKVHMFLLKTKYERGVEWEVKILPVPLDTSRGVAAGNL